MPIYDTRCTSCGTEREIICGPDDHPPCPKCGGDTKRLITCSGPNCANEDAGWIKSVTEVVDKDDASPHSREFLRNPTRSNYQAWMRAEGLRPLEPGEGPSKPPPVPMDRIRRGVMERMRERRTIEIRG